LIWFWLMEQEDGEAEADVVYNWNGLVSRSVRGLAQFSNTEDLKQSAEGQKLLQTLCFLLPFSFLSACDIIDRKAIQKYGDKVYLAHSQQQGMYEVRLKAWNCSCPAFAFATYSSQAIVDPTISDQGYGGKSRTSSVCKHLLAAFLAEHGGIFEIDHAENIQGEKLAELCQFPSLV